MPTRPLEQLSYAELREEIEREKRLLDGKIRDFEDELRKLERLRADLATTSGRVGGLTAALENLRADVATTSGRVGGLTGALRDIRSRYGTAISNLRWARRDIGRYRSYMRWRSARYEEWYRLFREASAREREYLAEIARLTAERRRRREELREARKEYAAVRRLFVEQRRKVRGARGEYERASRAFAEQRSTVSRIRREIASEQARIEYKRTLLPEKVLSRVGLNLYLIVSAGAHDYPRSGGYYHYVRPRSRRVRIHKRYPKGRLQSEWQMDAFLDPDTREIMQDEEPYPTLIELMKKEAAREFMAPKPEGFSYPSMNPDDLTVGELSEIASKEDLSKPPIKVNIARTDDETGRTWTKSVDKPLMSDREYEALTRNMTQYVERLEKLMEGSE